MKPTISIPAREQGAVRVFALSMTDPEAKALRDSADAVAEALGLGAVDMDHVTVFPLSDLDGVGLTGFLHEGAGVPMDDLAPDRAKLDKLSGWAMVVYSSAFEGRAVTLQPASALTLIGTYGAVQTDYSSDETLSAEAAKPFSGTAPKTKKKPSDAAMSGRIATLVLILLAIFTYIFITIGG
ncbi:hypothetical protein [Tateyamaria sp. SN6-1]|uniref:hypothetical protein n=1 Tax=Tateyamaria sp. SN6-1 TaxID=3092148 RepID=UPI0039F4E7AB